MPDNSGSSRRTRAKTQLLRLLDDETVSPGMVAAIAGDRPMTLEEEKRYAVLQKRRRDRIYSDILFAICHQFIPAGKAKVIWTNILAHQKDMADVLGRKVGVTVAALDYLTTIVPILQDPVIVSEPSMATVAEVAVKDGLTRLYDHTTFASKLREEMRRADRYGNEFVILMLDIDHFKKVNDSKGHQEGDRVLQLLGRYIESELRTVDLAARYGGEEFAVILPRTQDREAMMFAERLRKGVKANLSSDGTLTISIGLASFPRDGRSVESLVCAADRALYRAKENGRDQCVNYGLLRDSDG